MAVGRVAVKGGARWLWAEKLTRGQKKEGDPKAKRLCGHPLVAYLGVRLALSSAVDFLCSGGGQIC